MTNRKTFDVVSVGQQFDRGAVWDGGWEQKHSLVHKGEMNLPLKWRCLYKGENRNPGDKMGRDC